MNRPPSSTAPRTWAAPAAWAAGVLGFTPRLAAAAEIAPPAAGSAWDAPALAALAATALGVGILSWRRQRTLAAELQAARVQHKALSDLLDVWQWRSDVTHRLCSLRPPQGAPPTAWPTPVGDDLLWTRFRGSDPDALRACLDVHAAIHDLDAQLCLPDGASPRCIVRGHALTDAQGRFAGYIGTARVLSSAPCVADPGDSEQESFSYTVSHDLRAPIRVVEGFTKILKEDYGRLLDRIGNDHLDRVLGAAARMNCMIDALLGLTRLSRQPLVCQPVNLSQLAGYITDDLRRQAPERQVRVSIEPDLLVRGDPTLLRIALENLLGNAWKYTSKVQDAQIGLRRDATRPGPAFTVHDNGAGFDMRFADRLFGVFQRLHSANDFQGHGIGLASVRRIVQRHGGEIWAEAEVDRGASFHFTLG